MHITPLQGNNSKFSPTTVGNLDIYFAISGEERNIFSNHGGQFGCILLSYFRGTTIKVFSNRGGLFGGTNAISEKIFQTLWIIWMHIEPFQRSNSQNICQQRWKIWMQFGCLIDIAALLIVFVKNCTSV